MSCRSLPRVPVLPGPLAASLVLALLLSAAVLPPAGAAPAVRIKEIAHVQGVRENQLLGVGLVTGLAGRGDSPGSPLLQSALSNLVAHFGLSIPPADMQSRNCAVVVVSAVIPAFLRAGDRIDVQVSGIGDSRSLENGILLQTPLHAANGTTYAVAQGPVLTPRRGGAASAVGSIPFGAIMEREVVSRFMEGDAVSLVLRNPDFVTADAVRKAVQAAYPAARASSVDASLVEVRIPAERRADPVGFIAELESLTVTPDPSGKVVIDSASGIVILGEKVRIGKVAVSYQAVQVSVGDEGGARLMSPALSGEPERQDPFVLEEAATVNDLVTALQAVGLKTEAIIGILMAIERAGALYGQLIIR